MLILDLCETDQQLLFLARIICQLRQKKSFTPKLLANSSPGLSFGNPGITLAHDEGNPERVGYVSEPLQGLRGYMNLFSPGLPKHNPGLRLANTFGVWILFTVILLVTALALTTETPRTWR